MIEYMEQLSLSEQEQVKKTIQDLFKQTCILKIKYDPESLVAKDNPRYHVCNKHRTFIEEYLHILGCELRHDSQEHIFQLTGEGVPMLRLSLSTTKVLLLLKMIYRDKIMGEGLHASVTNLQEIRTYGVNTGLLRERLSVGEWREALRVLKVHQVIELSRAVPDMEDDTPIYIYSTINLYCPSKQINELLERYGEENSDTEEEWEDEDQEGIQTIMFD